MRQYEMAELCFHGKVPVGSEVEVDLGGTFTCGEESVRVKGFYAGEGVYKVRFLPRQAGTYTYSIEGRIADTEPLREEGSLEVEAAAGDRHGILGANGLHLQFTDGKDFHGFGTTVYGLVHQTRELIDETMETLAKAPFNKIRICVFPKHYQYNHNEPDFLAFDPKSADGVHHPDYSFWDALEYRLGQLEAMGIIVDLILFHPYDRWGFSRMSRSQDLVYLDYLIRRLAAYPHLMWSMANEYDLFGDKTMEDWNAIEEFIADRDPYHHMLSNHNCFPLYDYGRKNITHVSIQTRAVNRVLELQRQYRKPVFYDECAYEGNLQETFGSLRGEEMSNRFWKVTVTGGHCTHGETYIDYDRDNLDDAVVFWAKGGRLQGTSPERIGYLRELVESLPGPIDPANGGVMEALHMTPEEAEAMLDKLPEEYRPFVRAMNGMNDREKLYHMALDSAYAGHVGDQVYLYYYGEDVHGCVTLNLPEDKTYRIEVIDTWNMTRKTLATGQKGSCRIRTPQIQWMAIIAWAEEGEAS